MPRNNNIRMPTPSAPPINLMPDWQRANTNGSRTSDSGTTPYLQPPPSYEEAVASDETGGLFVPPPTQVTTSAGPPSPTSHLDENAVPNRQQARSQHHRQKRNLLSSLSPSHQRFTGSQTGSLTNVQSGSLNLRRRQQVNQRPRSIQETDRYRSASPGGLSDEATQDREGVSIDNASELKKKRSPGSKIKKGLEGIAWFIIQILD